MPDLRYVDRTDGVEEKLRLLAAAYAAGKNELAMSLAESIKDTLSCERMRSGDAEKPDIAHDHFSKVAELPESWSRWAQGWTYYKHIALCDTVGIARRQEPVDLGVSFSADQTVDIQRETRVARIDAASGSLQEIPSQVYHEVRRGVERRCRLVFLADAPLHESANYLVFYGNPNAELSVYATDLRFTGEGYGLDVENHHFIARLSRQMGQLERLTSKREHGLELFAGGKGHGEPPGIDWAHDYVDEGQFQKFRMRNWAECPNYEVDRGPLCVRVRRWGFPHSPIHPVFTPSRIHMDQSYLFFAGQPYFIKEARFDAIKDVVIEAMRDDEWVFSGYSFTDALWIDRHGKLHEGAVPEVEANDLWGAGFFHHVSRDAFVALRLEHTGSGIKDIHHAGTPNLHYDGHGQLWSRYPVNHSRLAAGASLVQRSAFVFAPYSRDNAASNLERLRQQLLNPLVAQAALQVFPAKARSEGALARIGETKETAPLKPAIWDALREVRDEQLYQREANIVDLGYVYDVRVRAGVAHVIVTMPHLGRPMFAFLESRGGGRLQDGIRERVARVRGVRDVIVEGVWNPRWTIARLSDAGRLALGLASDANL